MGRDCRMSVAAGCSGYSVADSRVDIERSHPGLVVVVAGSCTGREPPHPANRHCLSGHQSPYPPVGSHDGLCLRPSSSYVAPTWRYLIYKASRLFLMRSSARDRNVQEGKGVRLVRILDVDWWLDEKINQQMSVLLFSLSERAAEASEERGWSLRMIGSRNSASGTNCQAQDQYQH